MQLGLVILPTGDWPANRELWRWAESIGVATAWTYDHVTWRGIPTGPWFAAYPLLAAVAEATSTLRLGTLVSSPNLRHPVLMAEEVRTLDHLSAGRFELGIGAGSIGSDAGVFGGEPWSAGERVARFAEYVELLDRLLTNDVTSWRGRFYAASGVPMVPGCVQQPRVPFTVAGSGPKGIAVAAEFGDRWATHAATPDVPGQCERFAEACTAAGRDPRLVERVLLHEEPVTSAGEVHELAGRAEELRFTQLVLRFPHVELGLSGDRGVLEDAAAGLP